MTSAHLHLTAGPEMPARGLLSNKFVKEYLIRLIYISNISKILGILNKMNRYLYENSSKIYRNLWWRSPFFLPQRAAIGTCIPDRFFP
jgi:hypothetical protein